MVLVAGRRGGRKRFLGRRGSAHRDEVSGKWPDRRSVRGCGQLQQSKVYGSRVMDSSLDPYGVAPFSDAGVRGEAPGCVLHWARARHWIQF